MRPWTVSGLKLLAKSCQENAKSRELQHHWGCLCCKVTLPASGVIFKNILPEVSKALRIHILHPRPAPGLQCFISSVTIRNLCEDRACLLGSQEMEELLFETSTQRGSAKQPIRNFTLFKEMLLLEVNKKPVKGARLTTPRTEAHRPICLQHRHRIDSGSNLRPEEGWLVAKD